MAKRKNKVSKRNLWLLIIGVFIILFLVGYHLLPTKTLAPSQTLTSQEKRTAQNVFEGKDINNNDIKYSLNVPENCEKGQQGDHDVMPGFPNITCDGGDAIIIPNALGHGGIANVSGPVERVMNSYKWEKITYTSTENPSYKAVVYTLAGNIYFMIEVDYKSFTNEEEASIEESVLSTFQISNNGTGK